MAFFLLAVGILGFSVGWLNDLRPLRNPTRPQACLAKTHPHGPPPTTSSNGRRHHSIPSGHKSRAPQKLSRTHTPSSKTSARPPPAPAPTRTELYPEELCLGMPPPSGAAPLGGARRSGKLPTPEECSKNCQLPDQCSNTLQLPDQCSNTQTQCSNICNVQQHTTKVHNTNVRTFEKLPGQCSNTHQLPDQCSNIGWLPGQCSNIGWLPALSEWFFRAPPLEAAVE